MCPQSEPNGNRPVLAQSSHRPLDRPTARWRAAPCCGVSPSRRSSAWQPDLASRGASGTIGRRRLAARGAGRLGSTMGLGRGTSVSGSGSVPDTASPWRSAATVGVITLGSAGATGRRMASARCGRPTPWSSRGSTSTRRHSPSACAGPPASGHSGRDDQGPRHDGRLVGGHAHAVPTRATINSVPLPSKWAAAPAWPGRLNPVRNERQHRDQ